MQIPLQLTFQGIEPSEAIEQRVRQEVEKLQRFHERITSCRVVVALPHHRRHLGDIYAVRIDITIPGGQEIVVNHEHADDPAHQDVYVAIRDAFRSARRRLQDKAQVLRGDVKARVLPDHGRITQLFTTKDHGFIRGADGRDIYFHRNAVTDDGFDELEVGEEVRYTAREGESTEGPQASSVTAVSRSRMVG